MLDSHLHPRLKPLLNTVAGVLNHPGIPPGGLMLLDSAIGVLVPLFLALGWYSAALVAILFNRLSDGLDGTLAQRRRLTDVGGFFGITLDFFFYALVPLDFILTGPLNNVLAGTQLLFVFIGTGSSFLAFATLATRHQIVNPGYTRKSLYYLEGLTEGAEAILLSILCCLFPTHFAWLMWLFGALCWLTTATCICSDYQILKRVV